MSTEEVLETVTEWKVLLDLTEFILVGDTVILNAYLPFLPLRPDCSYTTASFFVPATVFFNHSEFSIYITFENVIKLNEISKM